MSSPLSSAANPPPPAAPAASDDLVGALQAVLAAHHAAVFSYPALGVHLDDSSQVQRARELEAAHRVSRDALLSQLASVGATGVAPAVDYRPAKPVADASGAQQWALAVEGQVASACRALLAATASPGATVASAAVSAAARAGYRRQAMAGLTTAAVAQLYWRELLTPATPTTPFPGLGG